LTYINLSGDRSGEKLCCEGAMSREIVEKVSQYAQGIQGGGPRSDARC
jgi:hypothetical protein